ncbi:MAG: hypothetical protein HY316_09100 [Acidobacteria bacterium]|nr:hypothetical protein [Acidobacteriota bacterium]
MKRSLGRAILSVVLITPLLAKAQSTDLQWFQFPHRGEQPAPRSGATIIDISNGLILFGGISVRVPRNDLWSYSFTRGEWTELHPDGTPPPARFGHSAGNQPVQTAMIVFGGRGAGSELFNDIWAYDYRRNLWRQVIPQNEGPVARYGHVAISDEVGLRITVSHGTTNSGDTDDTWVLRASNTWENVTPAGLRPVARAVAGGAIKGSNVDGINGQLFLFGGCASGVGACPLGDFWSFDPHSQIWTQHVTPPTPPARQRFGVASKTFQNIGWLILFGGMGANGLLSDTWRYDIPKNRWTELSPRGTPPSPREGHAAVYSGLYDGVIFFGGNTATGSTNDLWLLAPAPGAVVNAASFRPGPLVPGSVASLFGTDLAGGTAAATSVPLQTRLAEATLEVGGWLAPLFYVSPTQINFQVPWETKWMGTNNFASVIAGLAPGDASLATVPVAAFGPGIFTTGHNGEGQGAVLIAGSASVAAPAGTLPGARPAHRGEYIEIYATGLGAVDNEPASGFPALANPLSHTTSTPSVTIGGVEAAVTFAGLAPGLVGVYQVNVLVSFDSPTGNAVSVHLVIGDVSAIVVPIAIQ